MTSASTAPPVERITSDSSLRGAFPSNFLYGASSASYQIEGCTQEGGRGECNWDVILREKEDNGTDACNSYKQWEEDVKLLEDYGFNTYRFSIAWSRIKPLGGRDDPVYEEGIKYYSNLIDALLAKGIKPCVTIYHWDHPQELEKRYGGFANIEEIVKDFTAYAKVLFERFGDRVDLWITINEPHIFSLLTSITTMKEAWKHETGWTHMAKALTLCHAKTVDLYRKEFQAKQKGQIGITLDCDWVEPLNEKDEASVSAAQRSRLHVMGIHADPIYLGKYDDYLVSEFGKHLPQFTDDEWKIIKGSSDFFGLNHYGSSYATGVRLAAEDADPFSNSAGRYEKVFEKDGKVIGNKGHNGHPYNVPWGFRKLLQYIHNRYLLPNNLPIYITENGFAVENEADLPLEQVIADVQRQDYFVGYIRELALAHKEDGVKVGAFFSWSLLDNLEWIFGYAPRFGITAVDRENGFKRTPKDSAWVLGKVFRHLAEKK